MTEYKSSVMKTCYSDEEAEGCTVCEFLQGKRDTDTLLRVIEVLDDNLEASERSRKDWLNSLLTEDQIPKTVATIHAKTSVEAIRKFGVDVGEHIQFHGQMCELVSIHCVLLVRGAALLDENAQNQYQITGEFKPAKAIDAYLEDFKPPAS